jgi:DHA2 family multidrug resistance protein-like MFS transporter
MDWWSVLLSLVAILPVVYGIKELARVGAQWPSVAAIVAGLAFAIVFVRRQKALAASARRRPLLDLSMFRSRGFTLVLISLMLMTMLTGPLMMLNTQYFQLVSRATPLDAGLLTMPSALVSTIGFIVMPLIGRRIRPGLVIGAGLVLITAALILMAQVTPQTGPWPLIVGFALVSFGAAPLPTLGTNLIVGSVPVEKASSAASTSETSGQLGYALGIAVLGSIVTVVYRLRLPEVNGLTAAQQAAAGESISGALPVSRAVPAGIAAELQSATADAFCAGIQTASLIAAAVMAVLAVVCIVRLRQIDAFEK